MDLKELIAFKTIIEEGTFSKAAEKLHYAQSTITNQVQRLEKELGIKLFKREWNAELTEAGRIYANEVDLLIRHWNLVREKAASLQEDEVGNIRIGIIEILTDRILPVAIKEFTSYKPKVNCDFIVGNTDTLSKALLTNHALDFAFSGEPVDMAGLHFDPLCQEEISFIVDAAHPLAKKDRIELTDLFSYTLVTGGSSCLYRLQLEREFSAYSTTPFFHSVSQISAIPTIIRQTAFIGVVLSSTFLPNGTGRIQVGLKNPKIPIGVLRRRNSDFTCQTKQLLLQCFKEEIANVYN